MTLAPPRPDWDLDDREVVDDPDDYEYVDPDAVPVRRVDPDESPSEIPVAPI
jgi:hypothetical protein